MVTGERTPHPARRDNRGDENHGCQTGAEHNYHVKIKQKIGVFGGTFDPVHEGHLGLAGQVLARGIVDQILFVPALHPPHKIAARAAFADRIAMLQAALAGQENMRISTIEEKRQGPCYTVHTLEALQEQEPDVQLVFLMGADSLVDFTKWYRYEQILALADLLVLSRPGVDDQRCQQTIQALPGGYAIHCVSDDLVVHGSGTGKHVYFFKPEQRWPISSTAIRKQLAAGHAPPGVPAPVLAHIRDQRLYQN